LKDPLKKNTPVEKHAGIYVKREDLCADKDWPHFSKARGVLAHVASRDEKVIGVLDTYHSQAGWAVAAACKHLGKKCVNFWPVYKADKDGEYRRGQIKSLKLGAELRPLRAGRSAILYHQARAHMDKHGGYLMPNALKLSESIDETVKEVRRTHTSKFKFVVIPISSGTIAAGVLKGLAEKEQFPKVYIHLGYTRSHKSVRGYLAAIADYPEDKIRLIDEHYAYSDVAREGANPDFPCNPYYDLKAWRWLQRKKKKLDGKILFWNIGS
jgi:1-aminocyclopropane-1-carboxylate deaminase/D-cysteine desulfhydrase-like pyridoxal-dependent ACC family enzyme